MTIRNFNFNNMQTRISLCSSQGRLIAGANQIPILANTFHNALIQMQIFDGRDHYSNNDEPVLWQMLQNNPEQRETLFSKLNKNRKKSPTPISGTFTSILNTILGIKRSRITEQLEQGINTRKRQIDAVHMATTSTKRTKT